MLTTPQIKTISDIRLKPNVVFNQLKSGKGPFYLLYRSKLKAVLLDPETFTKLQEIAKDYQDACRAQEFEKLDKAKIPWVSQQKVKDFLK